MLEPSNSHTIDGLQANYSLFNNYTNRNTNRYGCATKTASRRDSTRSSGRAHSKHQAKSQILVGGQKLPISHRVIMGNSKCISKENSQTRISEPKSLYTLINKQESSDGFTMTQSSSYQSSMPSVNFYSLSNKIMENNKEIRRIEKILYKDESRVAKYKKPKNLLSSTNRNVQIFAQKVHELTHKQTQTKYSNHDSQRSQNKQRIVL